MKNLLFAVFALILSVTSTAQIYMTPVPQAGQVISYPTVPAFAFPVAINPGEPRCYGYVWPQAGFPTTILSRCIQAKATASAATCGDTCLQITEFVAVPFWDLATLNPAAAPLLPGAVSGWDKILLPAPVAGTGSVNTFDFLAEAQYWPVCGAPPSPIFATPNAGVYQQVWSVPATVSGVLVSCQWATIDVFGNTRLSSAQFATIP